MCAAGLVRGAGRAQPTQAGGSAHGESEGDSEWTKC